jgi:hypothetical protein
VCNVTAFGSSMTLFGKVPAAFGATGSSAFRGMLRFPPQFRPGVRLSFPLAGKEHFAVARYQTKLHQTKSKRIFLIYAQSSLPNQKVASGDVPEKLKLSAARVVHLRPVNGRPTGERCGRRFLKDFMKNWVGRSRRHFAQNPHSKSK